MSDSTSNFTAWEQGYAMGLRHAATGDTSDYSDDRCVPMEKERDDAARALDPRTPFGSADFRMGYEQGYQDALKRGDEHYCSGYHCEQCFPHDEQSTGLGEIDATDEPDPDAYYRD